MKKYSLLWLYSLLAGVSALGTYFVLLESNWMIRWFGRYAVLSYLVFPLCALVLVILLLKHLFAEKKVFYTVPVAIALVGCLLAFVLVNDGFMNKLSANFLRHEQAFIQEAKRLEALPEGEYSIEDDSLRFVLPPYRVICQKIDGRYTACCFLTVDTVDRLEGYVYIPYGAPEDWDTYGAWSDPLDIDGNWFFMSLPKE